jgi:spore coat protein U-like protein
MYKRALGIAVALGAALTAVGVPAATQTQTFTVNLTITADCVVGAGSDINFGSTGYLTANIDAAGSFLVGCTEGTVPDITLNDGLNSGACPGGAARCMLSATTGDYVNYDLYTDAGRTTQWTSALVVTSVTGSGSVTGGVPDADQTVDVFGRVPPQATPTPAADYTDTVTATVTF